MRTLVWKLRISALWGAIAVLTTLHMLLVVAAPGAIDDLRAGEINGMDTAGPATIMWVVFVLVPLLMAFLTFAVPEGADRWVNGVLGVVLAGIWVPDFAEHATPGAVLLTASVVVAGLLVAWHAWKWPAQLPVEQGRERVPLG
jgi:hypothetical protein